MSTSKSEIKSKYRNLYKTIEEILFRHDPVKINFGFNSDEYDPEVGTILPRLKEASGEHDVFVIIYEEFVRWFGVEITGEKDMPVYKEMAAEVWKAWQDFNR